MEIWNEEDSSDYENPEKGAQDDANRFACPKLLRGGDTMTAAHYDEEGENASGEGVVDRD